MSRFLLPRLHLDHLNRQTSVRDLRKALTQLPTKLDNTYDDAIVRIRHQVTEHSELALQSLSWISHAKRPLHQKELIHALAVNPGDHKLDLEAFVEIDLIISVSAGLLTIEPESQIIRLVHFTVEEYFKTRKTQLFPDAESEIVATCLTYMSFDSFVRKRSKPYTELINEEEEEKEETDDGNTDNDERQANSDNILSLGYTDHQSIEDNHEVPISDDCDLTQLRPEVYAPKSSGNSDESDHGPPYWVNRAVREEPGDLNTETLKHKYAFLDYAASHWGYHAQAELNPSVFNVVTDNLMDNDKVAFFNAVYDEDWKYAQETGAHLAARFDLTRVLLRLFEYGLSPNVQNKWGESPLHVAARKGQHRVVSTLIARGDVNINLRDSYGNTTLHLAIYREHEQTTRLIIGCEKADVNAKNDDGDTPLRIAARTGQEWIVQMLLDAKADVNAQNEEGGTALHKAAIWGYPTVARLLIKSEAKVNMQDIAGKTALYYAVMYGRESVLETLIAFAADVNIANDKGVTPLMAAVDYYDGRDDSVIRRLLKCDSLHIDATDREGKTADDWAVKKGYHSLDNILDECQRKRALYQRH